MFAKALVGFMWIGLLIADGSVHAFKLPTFRKSEYRESVFRNGTCYGSNTNIEIELSNGEFAYNLASICHNERNSETLFVRNTIRGADLDEGEPITRPGFKEAGFFPDISANECYTQVGQRETIAELVGSEELAAEYVQPGTNIFLSRGHLFPNGDGIQGYEKRATFYFVNVVGQWQSINGGNWNQLEIRARNIADQRQTNLSIYTGGFGVMTLDDVNGNPVEIWLGRDTYTDELVKKLPVPRLTWKVIHDETRNDAVAVIQINNPWMEIKEEDIICTDVCDQLSWVTWDTENQRLGYTYCCDVASFQKAVPYAPKLGSLPLLHEEL